MLAINGAGNGWRACLAMCVGAGMFSASCGKSEPEPRVLTFGPLATLSVRSIQPDCEEATPRAEFSTTISVTSRPRLVDSNGVEVPVLTVFNQTLSEGESVDRFIEGTLNVMVGDEVCLESADTREIDTLFDDVLAESRRCNVIEPTTTALTFPLQMERGSCTLSVSIPATVTNPVVPEGDSSAADLDAGVPMP